MSTQKQTLDDVIDYVVHQGFCVRAIAVTNGTDAYVKGDSMMGQIAFSNDNGATWKLLQSTDDISAPPAGTKLAVLVPHKKLTQDVAAAASLGTMQALTIGPARVHKGGIVLDNAVVAADVYALLESQSIQLVDDNGGAYTPSLNY